MILRHVGIPVENLSKAVSWYSNFGFLVTGYSIEKWDNLPKITIAKMHAPGESAGIELIEGEWQPHFAVSVPEIDTWMGDVKICKHPAYYVQDPWANWVEIVEVKG